MSQLVTKQRLLEILRGHISACSTDNSRPDFQFEDNLLEIMQLAADEAVAQKGLRESSGINREAAIFLQEQMRERMIAAFKNTILSVEVLDTDEIIERIRNLEIEEPK